jgi:hypothetical protein
LIRISLKGLANYMTASPTRQRKILRDFKFPDPEGSAQAVYYREARDLISAYHAHNHPRGWLLQRVGELIKLASLAQGQTAIRLRHNARALREYERHFGRKSYVVLGDIKLELVHANVRVTIFPDLHVREGGQEKIVKLEFGVRPPLPQTVKIIVQAMFDATTKSGLGIPTSGVLYIDVPRGRIHRGARLGSRMARDVESACLNIAAIWPTI